MEAAATAGGHEEVVVHHDRATGLRAIVAIHSTARGAALGGTRFHPYASDEAALADALALARAMSYKNALAGLDHGGGKAVIIGDPRTDKSRELFLAYGRFIESLGGRYVTAGDVGTDGRRPRRDARGVPLGDRQVAGARRGRGLGRLTAWGVFQGMRAAAEHVWGKPTLAGRRVGVAGLGKVGAGWSITWSRTAPRWSPTTLAPTPSRSLAHHPRWRSSAARRRSSPSPWTSTAPTRSGAPWTTRPWRPGCASSAGRPTTSWTTPTAADLAARGILYMPDFLVNAGGVIQVADELRGFDDARAQALTTQDLRDHARGPDARRRLPASCPRRPPTGSPRSGSREGPWADRLFPGLGAASTPGD